MQNSGQNTILAKLFTQYECSVRRFLRWKGYGSEDVDDLVQETFLRAHKTSGWDDVRNPKAFLMRIAYNAHADGLRKKARDVSDRYKDIDDLELSSGEPSPEQKLEGKQELTALQTAINELTPRVKQAVILIKILNLPYAEASEIMGVSVNTLENHITRGMSECRKRLEKGVRAPKDDRIVSISERRQRIENKKIGQ